MLCILQTTHSLLSAIDYLQQEYTALLQSAPRAATETSAAVFTWQLRSRRLDMTFMLLPQDPSVFWDAATLVDAFNANKDPNDTLADSGQSFTDYYLLSSGLMSYLLCISRMHQEARHSGPTADVMH